MQHFRMWIGSRLGTSQQCRLMHPLAFSHVWGLSYVRGARGTGSLAGRYLAALSRPAF